ncbi:MAG: phage tail sheath family protein [Proteobacteria bacterium]|nr:phage tail sheath family protein [Pseudomonadota bacterium]
MPEYLAPGVYIEEIERGPKPIEGVATSTAAFLGETARGTVKPRLVTSYAEFLRNFGNGFNDSQYTPVAVKGFFDNGGRRCYVARIVSSTSTKAKAEINGSFFQAVGPGTGSNRIWVSLAPSSSVDKVGDPIGFRVRAYYWDNIEPDQVFDPEDDALSDRLPRPSFAEDFDDLSTDPDSANYFRKRINNFDAEQTIIDGSSGLIEINVEDGTAPPGKGPGQALQGGEDGDAIVVGDFIGDDPNANLRRGLRALDLDTYRDVAIVHAPNAKVDIVTQVISHCENNRFRFAVVDCAPGQNDPSTDLRRTTFDSKYGAYYYPWLKISDARTGARRNVPPGGFVCGIYARSDNARGVFKSPANETVSGALDLEFDIDQRQQETLNPRGINVVRRFPGRGIRVWGARTISSDPLWRYVSVRRLFIFLEASIYRATQWVVFESNDHRLWARVKQSVTLFLRTQWREGALFGVKEEEAFSVSVGTPDTMTEDDILNGRLIVEVGIAPVRPAEFVIFRVFQKTREANS